jgi:hypothetical protein
MTVAALEARALREHLRREREPRPRRLLAEAARVIDASWDVVVGGDLAFPGAQRRRTARHRLAGAYIARLHASAAHEPDLAIAFVRVSGLVDRPEALLRPGIALPVLRHALRGVRRGRRRRPAVAGPSRADVGRPGEAR